MWRWSGHSRLPSFVRIFLRIFFQSCFFRPLCDSFVVGWSSLFQSYVIIELPTSSASSSIGSRVTSPCRCQVQSVIFAPLRTSLSLGLPDRLLQQCIQLQTLHVNLFAIYYYVFITFRSSYNVLSCHTMLAGALWGIKCDKEALPLRPVF
jgi:hypothetical protein